MEALEDPLELVGRDAGPLVGDRDRRGVGSGDQLDADLATHGRDAERVVEQVDQQLAEAQLVGDEARLVEPGDADPHLGAQRLCLVDRREQHLVEHGGRARGRRKPVELGGRRTLRAIARTEAEHQNRQAEREADQEQGECGSLTVVIGTSLVGGGHRKPGRLPIGESAVQLR